MNVPGIGGDGEASRAVKGLCSVVLLLSTLDMIGWWWGIPLLTSVLPGYATMKPNTALCLAVIATALVLTAGSTAALKRSRALGAFMSGFSLLVSGLSLLEYATGRDFSIDHFLVQVPADRFADPSGRMSVGTALSLTLAASALLIRDRLPRLSTGFILAGLTLSVSGILGFVFQTGPLIDVPWLRSLAVHTAVSLTLLQIAFLASRPEREPFFALRQQWRVEGQRRYLLLAVTILPVLIGWPVLEGLRYRRYDAPFALAFLVVLLMIFQTTLLWHDNRALRSVELQLRRSEAHSSRILESIGDGVIVTDADGVIERMNVIAENLTGWSFMEAKGRRLTECFPIFDEHTRREVTNPVEEVRRLGVIVGLANHTVLRRRNGSETHIEDSSAPIRGNDGVLEGIVLVFRSVDERKAAERLAKVAEDRLQIALEGARLGSWELKLPELLMSCSAACKANFGRTVEQSFSYADLMSTVHPEDLEMMQESVRTSIDTAEAYRAEYRIFWPDGSLHWIIASGRPLYNGSGKLDLMVGITLDVTERHQAAAALMQSEKLAAVGRLASSIAHEINNPLESVTNLLYLAHQNTADSQTRQYLEVAERELRRASAISNQTLRFYKQATKPRLTDVNGMIENVISVFQGKLINSQIEVELRNRAKSQVLCFDGEIRQVLSNLMGNAIDAVKGMPGRLLVRTRETQAWQTGERGIAITVADTGRGMSPATLKRVFEPFFSTKGLTGTGLGLWISDEIVRHHRGLLKVRSSQRAGAAGTVFTMFLPFHAVERLSRNETPASGEKRGDFALKR